MVFLLAAIAYVGIIVAVPRLWRAGRISDRTAAVITLFDLPFVMLAVMLFSGVDLLVIFLISAVTFGTSALFYRFALTTLADGRAAAATDSSIWEGFSLRERWGIAAIMVAPTLILVVVFIGLAYSGRL